MLRAEWKKCARFGLPPPHPRAFPAKVRAFLPHAPSFAHDSGDNALVPAFRPLICARFRRYCARSCLTPPHPRTIPAKVRAFWPPVPSFARDSGKSARVHRLETTRTDRERVRERVIEWGRAEEEIVAKATCASEIFAKQPRGVRRKTLYLSSRLPAFQ